MAGCGAKSSTPAASRSSFAMRTLNLTRSRTLSSPTCFDREIFDIVQDLLRQNLARKRAVRLLGVSASALQSSGWQEPLFDGQKRKSLEKLYAGIDQLRKKYGEDAIRSAHRASATVDARAKSAGKTN